MKKGLINEKLLKMGSRLTSCENPNVDPAGTFSIPPYTAKNHDSLNEIINIWLNEKCFNLKQNFAKNERSLTSFQCLTCVMYFCNCTMYLVQAMKCVKCLSDSCLHKTYSYCEESHYFYFLKQCYFFTPSPSRSIGSKLQQVKYLGGFI